MLPLSNIALDRIMHLDLLTYDVRSIGPWQSIMGKHHSDGDS